MTQDEKINMIKDVLSHDKAFICDNPPMDAFHELIGNLIPDIPEGYSLKWIEQSSDGWSSCIFLQANATRPWVDPFVGTGPTPRQAILNAMEKIND